ncbi:hypothetical protein [Nocardioides currus]|uniref:Uncharacterized protein n=1 Tax=Nocardioides currus TaxID=2133958 RepID=A0A2R7Z015_9ACTN|nr:hypothetical protein [Nocardioides currus]PUA81960.1 hypothetical protein C7S10_07940 [Nocardioides currus]
MAVDLAWIAAVVAAICVVCRVVLQRPLPVVVRLWGWSAASVRRHRPARPTVRPIELIASDARRLGHRFHHPGAGASFVKVESVRWAYDKVLGESCAALGVVHLLDVLPVGAERDAERERVEWLLSQCGLDVDDAA